MHRTRLLALNALAAILALLLGTALHASAQAATPSARLAPLQTYQVVSSANQTAASNAQTSASVTCPTGTKVTGGGALLVPNPGNETKVSLNSSYPTATTGWAVKVNSTSPNATSFRVYAVCAKKPALYKIVKATLGNTAGSQVAGSASCPSGTVPLGGGGEGTLNSVQQNLGSSYLNAAAWVVASNNSSASNGKVKVYAICGAQPDGYAAVAGTAVPINPNSQTTAGAGCPSGTKPLGGGSKAAAGATAVNLGSSYPNPAGTGWSISEINTSTATSSVQAYVVCAQTS